MTLTGYNDTLTTNGFSLKLELFPLREPSTVGLIKSARHRGFLQQAGAFRSGPGCKDISGYDLEHRDILLSLTVSHSEVDREGIPRSD